MPNLRDIICGATLGKVMMTERGGINKVAIGISNDWDHTQCIDIEQSQCTVRLSATYIPLHL